MPAITASAPGKVILFGEHAVVYGRPAIAVPVSQVQARATALAEPRAAPGMVRIQAPGIELDAYLEDLPADHPLARAILSVTSVLAISRLPACTVRVTSTIPIASGLGSGAAVTVAILRALSAFLGRPLDDKQVCSQAFEVEKLYHGNPSGIDNTVITYSRPVFFIRDRPFETMRLKEPITIIIGDTGVPSPTAVTVGELRQAWQARPVDYEPLFDRIGQIAQQARQAIETGQGHEIGRLMDENHRLLVRMGLSSPELDRLVGVARDAGAYGAKLSGGGRGGNMIALATPANTPTIASALSASGAKHTIITTVK